MVGSDIIYSMKTIVKSIFTLSAFTFFERLLGFFFKIYLSRKLGAASLGIYQVALSFYFVLLTFTTSGIPLIVSKRTAKCRVENAFCEEYAISTAGLVLSIVSSAIIITLIVALRNYIATIFADPISMRLVILMLPALLFTSVYSAFRGNLWGRKKYTLVSVLELVEQVCRIIACLVLLSTTLNKLYSTALSMSIACLGSAAAAAFFYIKDGGKITNPKKEIIPLLKSSAPVTFSRAASSVVASLIGIVVPYLLMKRGLSGKESMYIYGYSVGMAMPLMYVPLTFVGSMAFVMLPTLSSAVAAKNTSSVKLQLERSISAAIVLGAIFIPPFIALGEDIGIFVYNNSDAGKFLSVSAFLMIPLSVENITSSALNSLDLELTGLINYLIGSATTFAYLLIKPHFQITDLAIAMGIGLTLSAILHIVSMRKKVKFGKGIVFTLAVSALSVVPAYFITKWAASLIPNAFFSLAVASTAGVAFMLAASFICGSLKIEYFFNKK